MQLPREKTMAALQRLLIEAEKIADKAKGDPVLTEQRIYTMMKQGGLNQNMRADLQRVTAWMLSDPEILDVFDAVAFGDETENKDDVTGDGA